MTSTEEAPLTPSYSDPPVAVRAVEARLAPAMFFLAFVYLLTLAGLIHRAGEPGVFPIELQLMTWFLGVLWPAFVAEALVGYARRLPTVPGSKALARVLLVAVFPPMRMAWRNPATDRIWLPRLGWHPPGKPILKVLDKVFGGPMLVFAFLILPVLLLEYLTPDQVKDIPGFQFALDLATATIWVAFAVEFVLKVSASPSPPKYVKERWLDAAIVLLPTLQFVLVHWVEAAPLARLLRLGRAVAPDQLARLSRAYRLRGLLMKGWQAFLLLEGVARITGNTPEKRLRRIEDQIEEMEAEIAAMRAEAEDLRKKVAAAQARTAEGVPAPQG